MHRILVVDDNPADLALSDAALSRAGFEVVASTEPKRAVELAAAHEASLIVLDRRMPELDGLEVLARLRADARTRTIPVLLLSADGDVSFRIEGLSRGADDYLSKPFHPQELVLRVERLVATAGAGGVESLEGNLEEFPLADVLQTLAVGRKSGFAIVVAAVGVGRLVLADGDVVSASFAGLTGTEALLALIAERRGRFRFMARTTSQERAARGGRIDLQRILLDAAWIEDELAHRQAEAPPADAPLVVHPERETPSIALPLPFEEVLAALRQAPGTTTVELARRIARAPRRIELAIAWLAGLGCVSVHGTAADSRRKAS